MLDLGIGMVDIVKGARDELKDIHVTLFAIVNYNELMTCAKCIKAKER